MSKIIGNTTATPNPRPDWTQEDSTKADYIKNKPELGGIAAKNEIAKTDLTADVQASLDKADSAIQSVDDKVDKVDGKGLSTEDYTTAEKNKLDGIAAGAEVNVQADWNQTDDTADDYIKNKPTLGALASKSKVEETDLDDEIKNSLAKADSAIQSIAGLATETYVDNKVASIVDTAPEALNTLNELAAALGDDPNFATTVATEIGKKVDRVDGKGLSTNDYTTDEKNKLAGIAEGAEVNVQSDWAQTSTTADDYIKNKPTLGTLAAKDKVDKTDLSGGVQSSLAKADTAIQSIEGLATEQFVTDAIGQIPTPDVSGQINTHNTSANAHSDIRDQISALSSEIGDINSILDAINGEVV